MNEMNHEPVSDNEPTLSPEETEPTSGKRQPNFWIGMVAIAVIFVLGFAVGILYIGKNSRNNQSLIGNQNGSQQTTPLESRPTDTIEKPRGGSSVFYIQNNTVYRYEETSGASVQITTDGSDLIRYQKPKASGAGAVSFVRCKHEGSEGTKPYACSLVRRTIGNLDEESVVSLTSSANANGFYVGGQIWDYAWDPSGTYVAYISDEFLSSDVGTIMRLHLVNTDTKHDTLLRTLTPTAGRGGSLDDEVAVRFSPDGTKVLFVDTFLYPVYPADTEDSGSLFVFDVATARLLWNKPRSLVTFVHWITNTTIVAKYASQLIRIDLANQSHTANGGMEVLTDATGWFDFDIMDNTVYFVRYKEGNRTGLVLEEYDTDAKERKAREIAVIPVTTLGDSSFLVRTLRSCGENECEIDMLNGVTYQSFGVLNTRDSTIIAAPWLPNSASDVSGSLNL